MNVSSRFSLSFSFFPLLLFLPPCRRQVSDISRGYGSGQFVKGNLQPYRAKRRRTHFSLVLWHVVLVASILYSGEVGFVALIVLQIGSAMSGVEGRSGRWVESRARLMHDMTQHGGARGM